MSEIKVNSIKGVSATSAAITINNTDGSCTANLTNRTNKNLIINGAMNVAQRGAASTISGYGSVDRFRVFFTGVDENPTQAQADVVAGTTPYTSGFRKCIKVTNGNQTSGAGAGDYIVIRQTIEAQDMANSGWNYTSSSSNVTLQFWIKSSVAQNFYGRLVTQDGTSYNYPFETGSLSADTWTKITKTIPGNSNLTFNNDNGSGLRVEVAPFYGTDYTASPSLDTWAAQSSSSRTPDYTSTWYTTDDATLEITGLQLEVSDHATDFEHRSFAQELTLCRRYCQVYVSPRLRGVLASATQFQRMGFSFLEEMRAAPSAEWGGTQDVYAGSGTASITGQSVVYTNTHSYETDASTSGSLSVGSGSSVCAYIGGNEATLTLTAEL